jgi:signal transduction histidine kinase
VRALERERIAEGIHDDVLQLLAAARLHLGNLRPRAREEAASGAGYPDTDVGSSPGPLPAPRRLETPRC